MALLEFDEAEKERLVGAIKAYFATELDQDIGQFDAQFLLDFFAEQIGGAFYNLGLSDARALLQAKLADIDDALYEIEKPVGYR